MSTDTLLEQAVMGRRIEFAYYSNLHSDTDTVWHPGIITAIEAGYMTLLACIRLDGERRSALRIPFDFEGIRYLDEVIDVPELPMGRFHPTAADMAGEWEGVPIAGFEDDDIVLLTADKDAAHRALTAYARDMSWDLDFIGAHRMTLRWAVFEWQPEDAHHDWLMSFAAEGDDMAVHLYYLPA